MFLSQMSHLTPARPMSGFGYHEPPTPQGFFKKPLQKHVIACEQPCQAPRDVPRVTAQPAPPHHPNSDPAPGRLHRPSPQL